MSKPQFKPVSPWNVPLEDVKSVAEERNIPKQVFPKDAASEPKKAAIKAAAPTAPLAKLSIDIPEDVMHQVKQMALNERRSIRSLVLHALVKCGISVREEDLVEDGRKRVKAKGL